MIKIETTIEIDSNDKSHEETYFKVINKLKASELEYIITFVMNKLDNNLSRSELYSALYEYCLNKIDGKNQYDFYIPIYDIMNEKYIQRCMNIV